MKNDAMKNAPAGENERPLMLAPAFKDYIWGGERLKRDWGKQTDLSPLAESWELSCHEAGPSVVASGEWAGRTLAQVLAAHPQFVGTKAEKAGEFPLLIKLIDAAGPLSVQVHPDDDYAERVEHALGKTEMWYVLDAGEGAGIYYGFKRETTLKEMKAAIESNTLTELLNWVPVKKGETALYDAIQSAIDELKKDGTLSQLSMDYFDTDFTQETDAADDTADSENEATAEDSTDAK